MKTCTFLGHRDTPLEVVPLLRAVVEELAKKRPQTGHTAQEAWEIFQREYLPKIEAPQ